MIRLCEAGAEFPSFTLGPLTIEFGPGLTAVAGASGAGKSTLIAIAAGVRPADRGVAFIDGKDLSAMNDGARAALCRDRITFAAQQPLFVKSESIGWNLRFAASLRGVPRSRAREVLELFHLEHRMHSMPRELSGGELSRINTARALIRGTNVGCIFLDEPTAMLDAANASLVSEILLRESTSLRIIVATHDESLLARASAVITLEKGRLVS